MTTNNPQYVYSSDDEVQSTQFGIGRVELDKGKTAIVRFAHGLEECSKTEIDRLNSASQAILNPTWDAPLAVITRVQSEAIQSTNSTWGVFSRSRIELYPHQMWVCKRVTERWPARWLVADDVGLGKTIEAGLILMPILSREAVRRIMILCPASLVEQWVYRLRDMFDLRFSIYATEVDTPRSDFFNTQDRVVASLQTMRMEQSGRRERLLNSDPWDLVIVDEAHHLNFDEHSGRTLGYELIEELDRRGKVGSMIFFTGTPHRGKDYGFWALLRLLHPDRFDPGKPSADQYGELPDVMIRNNKQNVTKLNGEKLFQPLSVQMVTYQYSAEESEFYRMLTQFISTGKAYASSLPEQHGRTVILVLIAMQKLASSSIAAIKRALKRRLHRIRSERERTEAENTFRKLIQEYEDLESNTDFDSVNQREEDELSRISIQLMAGEAVWLEELIEAAEKVSEETKIKEIMEIIDAKFSDEPILLFTEYKATQSLVMSELIKRHGENCVTFINGDDRAEEVRDISGVFNTRFENREQAANKLNNGAVKFLVSTEAGGEGIDLQERCHVLFHVDLPWNPMRLHQRVGRLNRIGQSQQVQVIGMRNPDTIEALIWEKLDQKLDAITMAFGHVMEGGEDLKQLVIGMASPAIIRELFSEAESQPLDTLETWFDKKTASFGGEDALAMARGLVGNAAQFDFDGTSPQIPQVDLQDLLPFFRSALALNGRQLKEEETGLSFLTPQDWMVRLSVLPNYQELVLDRKYKGAEPNKHILGAGHPVMEQALRWGQRSEARVATLPRHILKNPLLVYSIEDRVTTIGGVVTGVVSGIEFVSENEVDFMRDWQLLQRMNQLSEGKGFRRASDSPAPDDLDGIQTLIDKGWNLVNDQIPELDLRFEVPDVTLLAILWPEDNEK